MGVYDQLLNHWQAMVASAFFNWEQDRRYPADTSVERVPGFTEVWGLDEPSTNNGRMISASKPCDEICIEDSAELVLLQHRPAWAEQLVLRLAGLNHKVRNLPYAVMEITGPLPCLIDFRDRSPVMLGRKRPGSTNSILGYLNDTKAISMGAPQEKKDQEILVTRAILDILPVCLSVLRYKDDHAWYQINKHLCIRSYANGKSWLISGLFQSWSERHLALRALPREAHQWDSKIALQSAHETYQLLERLIKENSTENKTGFLFNEDRVTIADALLFDHLLQSIADVHLVVALSAYPLLCSYTERLWGMFMDENSSTKNWVENDIENAKNPFSRIPLLQSSQASNVDKNFTHALELMETLSVGQESLQQRLTLLAKSEVDTNPRSTDATVTARDGLMSSSQPIAESARVDDTAIKSHQRADELWLALTLLGTATAFSYALLSVKRTP